MSGLTSLIFGTVDLVSCLIDSGGLSVHTMPKFQTSPTTPTKSTHDRGPTPYFHGRRRILQNFIKQLENSAQQKDGTIFLIQGAPGVGKTALLYECGKLARERKWQVADIHPDALWNTAALMRSLGRGDEFETSERTGAVDIKLAKGGYTSVPVPRTTISILKEADIPLLLILDEAQILGISGKPPTEQAIHATNTLKEIHNGSLERSVVLLAAGLGTTLDAFGFLGISRFAEGCFVELGALSKESERAVIHDWLTKKGGVKGDPTAWIDMIVQETHQWPRHVHSYAKHAAEHLKENDGIMTSQGLSAVIELGQEGRKQYYKQRVGKFYGDQLQCLVGSISNNPLGEPISRLAIISSLAQTYDDKAEDLLEDFIEKGILEKNGKGLSIPIPSMQTWLQKNYGSKSGIFPRDKSAP